MDFERLGAEEIRAKVLNIELRARKILNQSLKGAYRSSFQGHGMEFDQVREYQDGDDQRMVDWNVTARMGHPFSKKFIEERENSVMLAMDVSGSLNFGSRRFAKCEMAAEFAAVIAMIARDNSDRVGLFLFSADFELFVPPRKGKAHWQRMIHEILRAAGKGAGTDLAGSFSKMLKLLKKRSLVFLLSDFQDSGEFEKQLAAVNQRHHLVCGVLQDPAEREIPRVGLVAMRDLENGGVSWVDTDDAEWRKRYGRAGAERERAVRELFGKLGIDSVSVEDGVEYRPDLLRIFGGKKRVF